MPKSRTQGWVAGAVVFVCSVLISCGRESLPTDSPVEPHLASAALPNVLYTAGKPGQWDETLREIGNFVKSGSTLFSYYSAHQGVNRRGFNDVYVGVAVSHDNGNTWEKKGRVMPDKAEDPYVILRDHKFYMYYEEKTEIPDVRTSLAVSDDGIHFTKTYYGVLSPFGTGWQSISTSSPVAFLRCGLFILLYEGIGYLNGVQQNGLLGLAIGLLADLLVPRENPVYTGTGNFWDKSLATDDVISHQGNYYMTYHAAGSQWATDIVKSKDFVNWKRISPKNEPLLTQQEASTVMFYKRGECYTYVMTDGKEMRQYFAPEISDYGLPSCKKE